MSNAPTRCPACGSQEDWKCVDYSNKGFSVGKAAAGAILFGPIGIVGGAIGKKKWSYYCRKCGYSNEYK